MNVVQYLDVNSLSLSVSSCSGIPCSANNVRLTSYASSSAVMDSSVGWNPAALVCRSTNTNIESHGLSDPGSIDTGSFTMKSIVTCVHGLLGGCNGCSNP